MRERVEFGLIMTRRLAATSGHSRFVRSRFLIVTLVQPTTSLDVAD